MTIILKILKEPVQPCYGKTINFSMFVNVT